MKKFIVETYYTCTFKTVHTLDDLNDTELSKIDKRTDGEVEVIDVKLNNRKTKKVGDPKKDVVNSPKIEGTIPDSITNKITNANWTHLFILFFFFQVLKKCENAGHTMQRNISLVPTTL